MPLYHGIFDWLLKLGLLCLVSAQQLEIFPETRYDDRGRVGGNCTVFTHMNKAAGSTIKEMLTKYSAAEGLTMGLYSATQYLQGPKEKKLFLDQGHDVIAGGYTEGLRAHPSRGVEDCKWFTMFRQ